MIPLIDYGAIADLRKRMEASQAPQGQPELQPMPQAPIRAPLLAPAPPNQMLPVAEPRNIAAAPPRHGLLYAQNPPEYDGMFSDAELNSARPGKVQSLLGRLIGESPQNIMRSNLDVMTRRKLIAQGYADKEQARQDAETEREGLAAVRAEMPPPPDGSDYAATLSWNRQFIAKLMGRGLIKQAWQMSQYLDTTPPKETNPTQSRERAAFMSQGNVVQGSFDRTSGMYYDSQNNPRNDAVPVDKNEELTPYQRESLNLQARRIALQERNASKGGSGAVMRPPTEAQEKSFIFYNLMERSAPEIDRLMATGKIRPDMVTLALRSGVLDFATNRLLNDEEQQLIRAARDLTAGVLRKESGAAIKNDEILNTFQRLIPLSGEGAGTAEAKRKARANYLDAMRRSATPAINYYKAMDGGGVMTQNPDNPEQASPIVAPQSKPSGKPFGRY